MDAAGGLIAIVSRTAGVTVSEALAATWVAGSVATIVVEPVAAVEARPWLPGAFDTVATAALLELQVTAAVRSCVVASVNVPVAWNGCGKPSATLAVGGVTDRVASAAAVTVSVAVPC